MHLMVWKGAPWARFVGVALVPAVAVGLATCSRSAPGGGHEEERSSILLVVIDTLRADHLGAYGYVRDTSPNIDALASDSIVFERAMTPMATTLPAHVSIMTATQPLRHGVLNNNLRFEPSPEFVPFAEMMQRRGYETAAFVSAGPVSRETGLGSGFDVYDQPEDAPRRAEETVDAFLAWLDGRGGSRAPFFAWIHLWDPHSPYDPPQEYASIFEADEVLAGLLKERGVPRLAPFGDVMVDVEGLYNAYDGDVRYTDTQLGRALDRLKASGLYEDVAVVLASDHGEGLMQHGWLGHGRIHDEQLWSAMMIKPPASLGITPRRVQEVVSTMDVVPTVAGLLAMDLGEEAEAQFDGVNRLRPTDESHAWVLSERVHRQRQGWEPGRKLALTGRRWRIVVSSEGDSELFDLRHDPHELENVWTGHGEVAAGLERRLRSLLAAYRAKPRVDRQRMGGAHEEQLRALGYVD